jgi:hypothetical protein
MLIKHLHLIKFEQHSEKIIPKTMMEFLKSQLSQSIVNLKKTKVTSKHKLK